MAAILTTGNDGRATWVFHTKPDVVPVVSAVAVTAEPLPFTVVVEEAMAGRVTVRVWRCRPVPDLRHLVAEPAANVTVNVTATLLAAANVPTPDKS